MMNIPKRTEELVEEYNSSTRMSSWILAGLDEDSQKLLSAVQQLSKNHSDLATWHDACSQLQPDSPLAYLIHPGHEEAAGLHRTAGQALEQMLAGKVSPEIYQDRGRKAHALTLEIHRQLQKNAPVDQLGVTGSGDELKKIEMILQQLIQIIGHGEDLQTILRHDQGHDDWHRENGQEPCASDEDCAAKAAEIKGKEPCNCGSETCPKCGRQVVASSWIDEHSNLDSDW